MAQLYLVRSWLALIFWTGLLGQTDDWAERLFRSGERACAAGSYPEALATWEQLIQQAPKSDAAGRAMLQLAHHHLEREKNPKAALPWLDRIKQDFLQSPWAAEAFYLRGQAHVRMASRSADLREAVADFNRGLDLFPDHLLSPMIHLELGRALSLQGQWGRALLALSKVMLHSHPAAAPALLEAARVIDLSGDTLGCLQTLQHLRNRFPQTPEAEEALDGLSARMRHRLQRPPLQFDSHWPEGRQKWLKTPLLLAWTPMGELVVYQNELDRAAVLRASGLHLVGPTVSGARAMAVDVLGRPWLISKGLVHRPEGAPVPIPVSSPSGAFLNPFGDLWIGDAKQAQITILESSASIRTIPSPPVSALAPLPDGGVLIASDTNRSLLWLDRNGVPKVTQSYGKGLPSFKNVVALATDPYGHAAAILDGGDMGEGLALWGPDGALLRYSTFKNLGLSGRFKAIALDRSGAVLLADARHDCLEKLR